MSQDSKPNRTELSFEERKEKITRLLNQGGHDIASIPRKVVRQGDGDDYSSSDENEYNPRYIPR